MKRKTMATLPRWTTLSLLLAAAALTGCDRNRGSARLEVRTFALQHLEPGQAMSLIDPYVYGERPGGPGSVSTIEGALTVRETSENLDRIGDVLAEFDRPRPETRLHFQLIEADGFTERDVRIADVEDELRRVFQFEGYRLAGETLLTAMNASDLSQELRAEDGEYTITVDGVYSTAPGAVRLDEVTLWAPRSSGLPGDPVLQTTVSIRPGQTMVLGSSPKSGSTATLFLAVRAQVGTSVDSLQTR